MTTYADLASTMYDWMTSPSPNGSSLMDEWITTSMSSTSSTSNAGNNFWLAANALHSCVQYLATSHTAGILPADSPQTARLVALLSKANSLFQSTYSLSSPDFLTHDSSGAPAYWWDDYGWWGNTFALAAQNSWMFDTNSPIQVSDCTKLATQVFSVMQKKAWEQWEKESGTPVSGAGCWQHSPKDDPPGPQNTVVNSLFLNLCNRLVSLTGEETYEIWAGKTVSWFLSLDSLGGYDNGPSGSGLFIGQIYPRGGDGGKYYPWIGDQGLLVAGLADYASIDTSAISLATSIANTALARLVDKKNVLCATPFSNPNSTVSNDMVTGKGVFLRSLASALPQLPQVKGAEAVFTATADAANAARGYQWQGNAVYKGQVVLPTWSKDWGTFAKGFYEWWGAGSTFLEGASSPYEANLGLLPGAQNERQAVLTLQAGALDAFTAAIGQTRPTLR